jgi:transcriptional regulator with XRE-family HTH domain
MSRLGRELQRLRHHEKLSLRDVQARTGISNAYLSQLETGKAESPAPPVLQKLASLYGVPYDDLLTVAGYGGISRPDVRDLFLSHRGTTKAFVRELASDVESEADQARPLRVWLDEAEIRPGQSIPGIINEGLEKSRFIAIVMTPDYFASDSGWTDAEWHAALHADPDNRRAKIIPLLAEDCPYIPFLLRHLRAIDFRGSRYAQGLQELTAVLRGEPLPRPVTYRGQLISSGGRIDRASLVAERSVPEAAPDVVNERLFCNLLPVEHLPRQLYTGVIRETLMKRRKDGPAGVPSKNRLKEVIREWQDENEIPPERRFMPAFRVLEDRIITFHDLESADGPLAAIVEDEDIEVLDIASFVRDEDLRRILMSLLNMALARHLMHAGLEADDSKNGRFFFPARDGKPQTRSWTPLRKRAVRSVAKPVTKDGKTLFWRHQGAYLRVLFLANKFYIVISPTWVISNDGLQAKGGPDITKKVARWTGPERNLQVLYHVRFWTSVLRDGKRGPIAIRTGDQTMEAATVPAVIEQTYGIRHDQNPRLMNLLDEEAPLIAAEEEEAADLAIEVGLEDDEPDDEAELEEWDDEDDPTDEAL